MESQVPYEDSVADEDCFLQIYYRYYKRVHNFLYHSLFLANKKFLEQHFGMHLLLDEICANQTKYHDVIFLELLIVFKKKVHFYVNKYHF